MTSFDNDICYCHDHACPDKDRCYRYVNRAKAEFASYAASLRDPEGGPCAYLIPIKGSEP